VATLVGCGDRGSSSLEPGRDGEDALDEALRVLQRREPAARGGLSSHASMVAETLCELGEPVRALARVQDDTSTSIELPGPREAITETTWRAALGRTPDTSSWERNVARFGDWTAFFAAQLADHPWRGVLTRWLPRLLPGAAAAATHGAIRTAHAVRALERRETPPRVAELARGLAYWAASYQELPASREHAPIATRYDEALRHVPRWSDTHDEPPRGNIVAALDAAATLEGLDRAVSLVDAPSDPDEAFAEIVVAGAGAYLRHGTRHHTIAFVHAVTGPCALWRLLPYVPAPHVDEAVGRAWQLLAAIHAAYARREDPEPAQPSDVMSGEELVAAARDDHAIKLTEALLWAHTLHPDPILLAAARVNADPEPLRRARDPRAHRAAP
jgi:hypothetical protein